MFWNHLFYLLIGEIQHHTPQALTLLKNVRNHPLGRRVLGLHRAKALACSRFRNTMVQSDLSRCGSFSVAVGSFSLSGPAIY